MIIITVRLCYSTLQHPSLPLILSTTPPSRVRLEPTPLLCLSVETRTVSAFPRSLLSPIKLPLALYSFVLAHLSASAASITEYRVAP